jgi:hypothetical protein
MCFSLSSDGRRRGYDGLIGKTIIVGIVRRTDDWRARTAHWRRDPVCEYARWEVVTSLSRVAARITRTMTVQEDGMNPNPRRTVEELAADLDDLTTTAEELEIDPAVEPDSANLQKLQQALEDASDATDALDQELDDQTDLEDQ